MRNQRSCPSPDESLSPAREDAIVQATVLLNVIELHPVQVTVSELIREIARNPRDFAERDNIERAVRDLAGMGLLHWHDFLNRRDALVLPTRAALSASELLELAGS